MTARRIKASPERALVARAPLQRDIMEVKRLLANPSEHITRATSKATGIIIPGEWRSCVKCDQFKPHRHRVPRTTNNLPRSGRPYCTLISRARWTIVDEFSYDDRG